MTSVGVYDQGEGVDRWPPHVQAAVQAAERDANKERCASFPSIWSDERDMCVLYVIA